MGKASKQIIGPEDSDFRGKCDVCYKPFDLAVRLYQRIPKQDSNLMAICEKCLRKMADSIRAKREEDVK